MPSLRFISASAMLALALLAAAGWAASYRGLAFVCWESAKDGRRLIVASAAGGLYLGRLKPASGPSLAPGWRHGFVVTDGTGSIEASAGLTVQRLWPLRLFDVSDGGVISYAVVPYWFLVIAIAAWPAARCWRWRRLSSRVDRCQRGYDVHPRSAAKAAD